MSYYKTPYGNKLCQLLATDEELASIRREELNFVSLDLDWRQVCQLEQLINGAYSPLSGYMDQASFHRVLSELRLFDGTYWPEPVVLAVDEARVCDLHIGQTLALRDAEGFLVAVLELAEWWPAAPELEMQKAVAAGAPLSVPLANSGQYYLAGKVTGVAFPPRPDFAGLRRTPAEVRAEFQKRGWRNVIAYQPGQPIHRAHLEFLIATASRHDANLLLQPTGGADPVQNAVHFGLIRSCMAILPRFPSATTLLTVSAAMASHPNARTNLSRAIIARNHGCAMVVIGGETCEEGSSRRGGDSTLFPMRGPVAECAAALAVEIVPFPRMVYVEDRDEYFSQDSAPTNSREQAMGGDELQRRLERGLRIPEWVSYPEVLDEMKKAYPPRSQQGVTVFFTGLSGAGKSTVAKALAVRLMELGPRRVTLLDGDLVRKNLSSELGFSREHRDLNIRRIGFVAEEITKHGGIAICAPIAPYRQTRQDVRNRIETWGGFIEVHMATPLEVCERRDRKGLYAKARAGIIREFTGISDPYEAPTNPELSIDTSNCAVEEAVQSIVLKLEHEGFLR
jgi:sulfate adenylyltransferase